MTVLDKVLQGIDKAFPGRAVSFDRSELPTHIKLPDTWDEFGLCLTGAPNCPSAWKAFADVFPSIEQRHTECLLGTALLVGETLELLYIFYGPYGFCYYLGGAPAAPHQCETDPFKRLPKTLQAFYETLHDGYTFFPARSMGPQKLEDMIFISDLIDEDDVSFAQSWLAVFSNGGGHYVAVDTKSSKSLEGLVWWHENPEAPEMQIDVFEVMDAWMAIFLEDTALRAEAVVKLS